MYRWRAIKIPENFKEFYIKNKGTIFAGISCVGVIASSYLSYRAGEKSCYPKNKEDKVKLMAPVISVNALTIASILMSDNAHRNSYAILLALYSSLEGNQDRLCWSIEQLENEEQKKIKKSYYPDVPDDMVSIDPERQLFYFMYGYDFDGGEYFESTIEDVRRFEYLVNRQLFKENHITLNDILSIFGLSEIVGGDRLIYSINARFLEGSWIDFVHELITMDDGLECFTIQLQSSNKHTLL